MSVDAHDLILCGNIASIHCRYIYGRVSLKEIEGEVRVLLSGNWRLLIPP